MRKVISGANVIVMIKEFRVVYGGLRSAIGEPVGYQDRLQ